MFTFIRRIFRDWADATDIVSVSAPAIDGPAAGDSDIPAGRRGNTPVYVGGYRDAVERLKLRPTVTRSTRHSRPHPVEQSAIGLRSDQDFEPAPGPMAKPKAGRSLLVLDNGPPPDHQPYGASADDLTG